MIKEVKNEILSLEQNGIIKGNDIINLNNRYNYGIILLRALNELMTSNILRAIIDSNYSYVIDYKVIDKL